MKKQRRDGSFVAQLRQGLRSLKFGKRGEMHILNINANYGHYQIVIGPMRRRRGAEKLNSHPIEIHGEIHHIFLSPHAVRVHPSKRQMMKNMKDTVIVRDLTVHIHDPKGDGRHISALGENDLRAREYINLAGRAGEHLLEEARHSRNFSMATYRIIQTDIISALREKSGKTGQT